MVYTVKVQIFKDVSLEVSGEDIALVVQLLNGVTKKFFHRIPASKIEI